MFAFLALALFARIVQKSRAYKKSPAVISPQGSLYSDILFIRQYLQRNHHGVHDELPGL